MGIPPEDRWNMVDAADGRSATSAIPSRDSTAPRRSGTRDAAAADRPALLDLWVLAWRGVLPEIDFEARRPWLDAHLDALLASGARLLVAEADGAPAGFVTVDPARRHLDQLAVHPRYQGGGVADRLMAGAKALSPDGLALEVNVDNARARRFYARRGFVEVGTGTNPRSGLSTLMLRWGGTRAATGSKAEI